MNLRMESTLAKVLPSPGQAGLSRQVAVIIQDRTIYRETLDILSGWYDLIVLRQFRDLAKNPINLPDLILVDSGTLLTLGQAGEISRERTDPPILAMLDEAHLQTAGLLLAKQVQDFLVRPFTAVELLFRVSLVLLRSVSGPPGEFTTGDFRIDLRTGEVYHGERPLPLTRKEVALLYALARRMGRTVTRDELLNEVWGVEYDGISNVLDVHIRSLRRKIEPDPAVPRYIKTFRGIGYRFTGVP